MCTYLLIHCQRFLSLPTWPKQGVKDIRLLRSGVSYWRTNIILTLDKFYSPDLNHPIRAVVSESSGVNWLSIKLVDSCIFLCLTAEDLIQMLHYICDNTRFCSSLHKLLSPRLNTFVGRIKARSRFTEKRTRRNNNLWLKRQGMMRSV